MKTDYAAGQREFARWLSDASIRLAHVEDLGVQRDADDWNHFAWELTVKNWHRADGETTGATSYVFPYRQGLAHTKRPTLTDIMAALLSDAGCVIGSSFEDFCAELGYDPDSRKAEALYKQIKANNGKLCKLFRTVDLESVLAKARPLMEAAGL